MNGQDPFAWCGAILDGKYRIDSVVGEGGFGLVYKAHHLGLRETVAVKCLKLPGSLSPPDRAKFQETFLDEGRLLHRLSRANAGIAQALDVGTATSPNGAWTPYLVLEWLEGRTLEDELAARRASGRGCSTAREAVELLTPAAMAIAEAHEQGIAHRDIKPANLFLTRVGASRMLKVLDFGIAKVLTGTTSLTRALEATGGSIKAFTPQYGAPEQFDPRYGATGPWTDVFALALVFVELLVGRPALEGQDTIQLMVQSANPNERPTPRLRGADVPQAVEDAVHKALEVQPRDRYLAAGAFWAALKAAVETSDSPAASGPGQTARSAPGPSSFSLGSTALAPRSKAELAARPASTTSPQVSALVPPAPPSARTGSKGAVLGLVAAVGVLIAASVGIVWFLASSSERHTVAASSASALVSPGASSLRGSAPRSGPDMVRIPAGVFSMGSADGEPTERPVREVTLTRSCFIDATEVTVEAYMKCVRDQKCSPPGLHGPGTDEAAVQKLGQKCNFLDPAKSQHPVNCVDRGQADAYCKYAGKRLPTEAEWEYAARGSDSRLFPWGSSAPSCSKGVFAQGSDGACSREATSPVGMFADGASAYGALDMAGNVREWVADAFDERAYSRPAKNDPLVANPAAKGIVRGGAWDSSPADLRSSRRVPLNPGVGDVSTGFRCARTQ